MQVTHKVNLTWTGAYVHCWVVECSCCAYREEDIRKKVDAIRLKTEHEVESNVNHK